MTRDIRDRLYVFGAEVDVRRIALNFDQVQKYNPPPNPAKTTDSRYAGYLSEYGEDSWELDALEPKVLSGLIDNTISDNFIDLQSWEKTQKSIVRNKKKITEIADKI